ncbi:peptidase S28 [Pavlovales sp. CCMP2436]|nr:peptidase S28 [Pavlovales sp. CCMP2436]
MPPVPPPLPFYYVAASMEQRCDHFNALNADTFQQRYLVNDTFWGGPGAPILLYTGAEGDGIESVFAHSGYVLELARELKALAVFSEMRFFGVSMPYGEHDSFERRPERLGLLSIEQTLADNAHLVTELRTTYKTKASRVVALGGSLAGTLAFLLRAKYPALVHAALAASAPIFGYANLTDPYGWYRVATATFEKQVPGCPHAVRAAFAALLEASPTAVSKAYDTCRPADDSTGRRIAQLMTDKLSAMATAAYPKVFSPVLAACKAVMTQPGVGAFAPLLVPAGACFNVSTLHSVPEGLRMPPSAHARLARGAPGQHFSGASTADLAWFYLACTEIVHPIAANNRTDMFPPFEWDPHALARTCHQLFGVTPRLSWIPESMGMAAGPRALASVTSRVIFSNGLLDPWSAQSLTANASRSLVALNMADGSHHSDLGSWGNPWPGRGDSDDLVRVRREELALLRQWLAEDDHGPPAC